MEDPAGIGGVSIGLVFGYVQAVKTEEVGELAGLDTTLFTPGMFFTGTMVLLSLLFPI